MNLIWKIVIAVVIAALVGLVLSQLLGPVLTSTNIPIIEVVGRFFAEWGWVIGVIVGLLWFFRGGPLFSTRV